jgi:lysophospholipase L1-like esterase
MPRLFPALLVVLFLALSAAPRAADNAPLIDAKTRLAVLGDSITEQKIYSRYLEAYLVAVAPVAPELIFQFGLGGESAYGMAQHFASDVLFSQPNLATICFGMNDGNYRVYEPDDGKRYRTGMERIAKEARDAGATLMVGGPGAADSKKFGRPGFTGDDYNVTLGKLNDIAKEVAEENHLPYVDVHHTCIDAMVKAKEKLGADYPVMGYDGVHPGPNGQLSMAFAFLKAMNFSGDLGTITIDLAKNVGAATGATGATGAHTLAAKDGCYEIVSSRWIFCFTGNPENPQDVSSLAMMPFLPFNETLNRFTLKVTGLTAPTADVQWGAETLRFTKDELAQGINLAEKFAGKTPFQEAWKKLDEAITKKQNYETWLIKDFHRVVREAKDRYLPNATEIHADFEKIWDKIVVKHPPYAAAVKDAVTPVTHELRIVPVE